MARLMGEIRKRFEKNKNWLCVICGGTGSGKSMTALRLAETLDPTFSAERVVWSAEEFLNVLNSGLKRGQFIVFDEAGVGMPSRQWFSISNKAINYVLQTFRHEGIGVIFTVPDFSFIDSQSRKMFHTYIETRSINHQAKYCSCKWLGLQNNPRMGKQYTHTPRYCDEEGAKRIDFVHFYLPSEKLLNDYEKEKTAFAIKLREQMEEELKDVRKSKRAIKKQKDLVDKLIGDEKVP